MKTMVSKIVLMIVVLSLLLGGCASNRQASSPAQTDPKPYLIVTSFYPMYIETLNVTKDIPGVKVVNMAKEQTGCLHDYALTPADLKLLEGADVFVVNGAGMESFLDKVISQQLKLKVVQASEGIPLIKNESDGENNPHVWVSISDAILQVKNIGQQLALLDASNALKYQNNTAAYVKKLETLKAKMHKSLDNVANRNIITFHEAFPYFAQEFNLNVAAIIEREPGSEPSPKELQASINTVKESKIKGLFAEPQYPAKAAETIARETGAQVYVLDPIVTGDGSLDSYLNIMELNLKTLEKALGQE